MNVLRRKTRTRADTKRNTALAYFISGDTDILPDGYIPLSKNEDIIKCANIIADLVSSMTIMLMANGKNGDIRLKNELSKKIDVTPCKFMTRKNFIFKIVKDMIMTGNSIAYPEVTNGSFIENITPLNAKSTCYRKSGDSYVILYNGVEYNPDELLHFVLVPDQDEPFRGEGYTSAILETITTLTQAYATKKGFLRSKWKPSIIISVNSDIEEIQDKEKRNKIIDSYTGNAEAGEPWLIPAGEIDVKTIQPLTLNDLAIQDSITLDKKSIARAFGIPPFMVGVGEFNKDEYNNFIATKIMSTAMIVQQELTKKLLVSDEMYFKMNPKSLMQYALDEQVAFVKEMVSGGMLNRNEGRCEFDYSPADDDGLNEYIVLENYIPVSKVGEQKKLKESE